MAFVRCSTCSVQTVSTAFKLLGVVLNPRNISGLKNLARNFPHQELFGLLKRIFLIVPFHVFLPDFQLLLPFTALLVVLPIVRHLVKHIGCTCRK